MACDRGLRHQVLLGATGTGKTFTAAKVIEAVQKPTLVMAHNKTLAAQLYQEFKEFFPDNAVEYFVSYYDYFQPEAYLPRSDTYIEKDSSRNDEIDRLRHNATRALFERRDVIIVASVSCIYGLGRAGRLRRDRDQPQGRRPATAATASCATWSTCSTSATTPRWRAPSSGCAATCSRSQPPHGEYVVRVDFFGDEIERIVEVDDLTGEVLAERTDVNLYPATPLRDAARQAARRDRRDRGRDGGAGRPAARRGSRAGGGAAGAAHPVRPGDDARGRLLLRASRTTRATSPAARRASRPWTLIDYFPTDFLLIVDESHITIPQVHGMYKNDRTRKEILVDFGFRLPSALDNRPLTFEEFEDHMSQVVYMSADARARTRRSAPSGSPSSSSGPPAWSIRRSRCARHPGQIDDLLAEIRDDGRARRAGAGHHADQEDGRGPGRLPGRAGDQGAVAALRGRHARADRDPARPAPRACTTCWSASTCCARGSTCRR